MALHGVIEGKVEPYGGQSNLVPWWSFTKTVLAGAALALVAQHRLDLDEPVKVDPSDDQAIDDRAIEDAPTERKPFTLRHLLQHTSGLPDYGGLPEYHAAVMARQEPWTHQELLQRVSSSNLLFAPGTSWAYSNVGYLFVRRIIEQTMDSDLDLALRALVFDPLGIHSVFIARTAHDLDCTVWGNERRYHPGWVYHGLAVGPASAAAGVLDRLLYSPFLPSHLKTDMLHAVSVGGPFAGRPAVEPGYGLGLMVDLQSPFGRMAGHTGQGPGSTAAVYSFPDLSSPRTIAAFAPVDGADSAGALETYVQTMVKRPGLDASPIRHTNEI
jgi:CubicO group peptidase (beta-lactamase class C family)